MMHSFWISWQKKCNFPNVASVCINISKLQTHIHTYPRIRTSICADESVCVCGFPSNIELPIIEGEYLHALEWLLIFFIFFTRFSASPEKKIFFYTFLFNVIFQKIRLNTEKNMFPSI